MTVMKQSDSLPAPVESPTTKASQVQLFNEQESELVSRALVLVSQHAHADAAILSAQLKQLAESSRLIWDTPSLRAETVMGGESRNGSTLIEHLCRMDGLEGDLSLPVKAVLQRTFLLRKIQFFRGFVKTTRAAASENQEMRQTSLALREEYAQSVYTLMAEELLLALLRKPTVRENTKQRAANQLIAIWDSATLEIDQFCPLLESAWHARNRVTVGLGSLLGASEYFRLVAEHCDPQFLDFFERDEVSKAENQAFTEFLFGLTFEEFNTLQEQMTAQKKEVVTSNWASAILNRPIEQGCSSDEINPVAMYRSYSRRQLAADFRILAGTEGPERTAEAYLMIFLLDQQA